MKFLIVGLGNIGDGYADTRHNIGFTVLDAMAKASNTFFTDKRYGAVCQIKFRGKDIILLKPSTFMNLSGNAVRYWLGKEKIEQQRLLVIADDLALPTGSIRMRAKGGAGGHNGLSNINEVMGSSDYARIRIGIGNDFAKGRQVDYVLGAWTNDEKEILNPRIDIVIAMIRSFCLSGAELTMTAFNKQGKVPSPSKTGTESKEK
jgi:peptidyl-tRNA hydrolase, PTH1 family